MTRRARRRNIRFATETRRKRREGGDKNKRFKHVFMQELDSKDKIATRLQPTARKFSRRRLSACGQPSRSTFALKLITFVLVIKSLAIMNFL
jgi:hypothetical protein